MKYITLLLLFFSIASFGQSTTILLQSVEVEKIPSTKESGKAWDNFMENYKPDVYIRFFEKYHSKSITTDVIKDFTSGSFIMSNTMIIMANDLDTLTITFYDEDSVTEDDYIGSFEIPTSKLKIGSPAIGELGNIQFRTLIADDDNFKFTLKYLLKSDIDNYSEKNINTNKVTEASEPQSKTNEKQVNTDKRDKEIINGSWKSSCGRSFMLIALGSTKEDAMIKQFVADKEIIFKPILIGEDVYFQTLDKSKKFIIQDTGIIQYETSDGFKCTWSKE